MYKSFTDSVVFVIYWYSLFLIPYSFDLSRSVIDLDDGMDVRPLKKSKDVCADCASADMTVIFTETGGTIRMPAAHMEVRACFY